MIKEKYEVDYGKVAFLILILIIGFWFFSHFRISIIPVSELETIFQEDYYECPGVGLQSEEKSKRFLGCSYSHTEPVIKSETLKKATVFWWRT